MDTLAQDLRYAFRTLLRSPGFSVVAVLTLALGIGAATAIFSVVNTVLLRPLAFDGADRLVALWERTPPGDRVEERNYISPANLSAWKEQTRSFDGVAGWFQRPLNLTGDGEAEEVQTQFVTDGFFSILRTRPALGRVPDPVDHEEGTPTVVVLSHDFWQRRFQGDAGVVGRVITLNDEPAEVVGVMPDGFGVLEARPDVWAPMYLNPEGRGRFLTAVGRLRDGATLEGARAELATVAARQAQAAPELNTGWGVTALPLHEATVGDVRPALLVMLGAVGLLLLIACANVANLLLSRAAGRRREVSVRASLGASRGRLVRQLLTESLVLAVLGGALGLLVAFWGTQALLAFLPAGLTLPRLDEVGVDGRVLAFALAASLVTGALFGLAPALTLSRSELQEGLRESARGSTGGRGRGRLRGALVVAEVALSLMLLVGAGLLGRSFLRLQATDTGINPEQVLTLRFSLPAARYGEEAQRVAFYGELYRRLEALPGVRAAATEAWLPLRGDKSSTSIVLEGRPPAAPGSEPGSDIRAVGGDYFRAMGVPLLRGRGFDATDTETSPVVFVVNEELARRYYPGEDPLGRRISYQWGRVVDGEFEEYTVTGEIVGVVGSVRESGPAQEPAPGLYRWYRQDPWSSGHAVLRVDGDPMAVAEAARAQFREMDPLLAVADVRAMTEVMSDTVARPRFNTLLLGVFSAAALLLAGLGIYGVIAYGVAQRAQEIGIRVALGAARGDVQRLVVGQGIRLVAVGVAVGLVAALALSRVLRSLLFEISPTDPVTLALVPLFLVAVALLASWLPARRAARVDPMAGLRAE